MSDQLQLFSEPAVRRTDPSTSRDAAAAVTPEAARQECRIMERFAMFGPMNDDELCARSPQWHPPTIKTARSRLSKRGFLVDTGERRPSNRGRDQIVWKLTEGGTDG